MFRMAFVPSVFLGEGDVQAAACGKVGGVTGAGGAQLHDPWLTLLGSLRLKLPERT